MKIFKILSLSLLLFSLISSLILLLGYKSWEKKFFSQNENIVCSSGIELMDDEIEEKIESFVTSDTQTDFVTFLPEEIIHILKSNIQVNSLFSLEDVCVLPSKGTWSLYLNFSFKDFNLPLIALDIVKDNRETAEIYVRSMYIGNYSFPKIFTKGVIAQINKGITDAIILTNENEFLGRKIRNIELLQERVVIKGSL